MRQELKIKPKHWLMALGALMCAFVMALMLIFVLGLLKPSAKFFLDSLSYYWLYFMCNSYWLYVLSYSRMFCKMGGR